MRPVLSAVELIALASGVPVSSPPRVLECEELNELPNTSNPFSQGLTAQDYRTIHNLHGRALRLWQSTLLPDGTTQGDGNAVYIEVDVSAFKGMFYEATDEKTLKEFGEIPIADAMLSTMPDEIEPCDGDYILDALPVVSIPFECHVTRAASGAYDELNERFVVSGAVFLDGTAVSPSLYAIVSATSPTEAGRIQWLSGAPAAGTAYTFKGRMQPLYSVKGEEIKRGPVGSDGARLPQRTLIRRVKA